MTIRPGLLYLVDTSAIARARSSDVGRIIDGLTANRSAATCVTIDLEIGYSGRTPDEMTRIADIRHELYVTLPITEAVAERARTIQLRMAARGHHRAAGVVDLLTAAVAEIHDAVLLHYDADFEHIAATTGQRQQWIVPRGSVD